MTATEGAIAGRPGRVFRTAELRWFLAGEPPQSARQWHEALCSPECRPQSRIDRYLRLPEVESLGVKLREGHLELKWRTGELGPRALGSQVVGQAETWEKWSLPVAAAATGSAAAADDTEAWLPVRKERRLQMFVVDPDGSVRAAGGTTFPRSGCGVELTRIEAAGVAGWSVALEAFGPEEQLVEVLEHVAARVLRSGAPPGLTAERSCGYPRWLRDISGSIAEPPPVV